MALYDVVGRVTVPEAIEMLGLDPPPRIPGLILCPRHDDSTPSLSVEETVWYCHGCGLGGSVVDFVRFAGGVSVATALAFLESAEDPFRVQAPQALQRPLEDLTSVFERERSVWGTDAETVGFFSGWVRERFGSLLSPERLLAWGVRLGRWNLFIPHRDASGVVRGVKLRLMVPPDIGRKSAIKGSAFTTRLYRVVDRPEAEIAYVAEGETDTWALSAHYADEPSVAIYGLPSGAGTWRDAWLDDLRRHPTVLIATDPDEAGERAAARLRRALPGAGRQIVPAKDALEALRAGWRPV